VLRTLAARLIDVTTREDPMASASSTAADRRGQRAPFVVTVVVVGRAPEEMREAATVLEADGFTVIGVSGEAEALSSIADHPGLLAVVAGGSVTPATRRRLRVATPVGAVIIDAGIGHGDPADHFRSAILPQLDAARTARALRTARTARTARTTDHAQEEAVPPTISAHIVVRDPERALAWYVKVFGAEERSRIPLPGGKIMTIEVAIGDSTVMVADELPDAGIVSPLTLGGTYGALVIATDDADTIWQRALDAGAEVFHPLGDTFWGERFGQFVDPFGHRWGVAQHLRDVPQDEIVAAAAEAFGPTPP
jgi:PhnB protein